MTEEEMLKRIRLGMSVIESAGCNFGRVELIVKDGKICHVNISFELLNTERSGENRL